MSDCVVVLDVREIPAVLKAYDELPVPKLWLSGYTEVQLAGGVFAEAIESHEFDRYFVCSDDILVRPGALLAVQQALDDGWDVATGYSQRTHTEWVVNVTAGPLRGEWPAPDAYEFRHFSEVVSWPEHLVPSWFAGFSLTGMSREMWQRFPFGCFSGDGGDGGFASDFHLSKRLQDAEVPVVAVREAFCYHMRHAWEAIGADDHPVLIGQMTPGVRLEMKELVA